jgi:anti-sigma-K factor RskA
LRAYREAARVLPYAASEAAPSPDLRGRILAAAVSNQPATAAAAPRRAARPPLRLTAGTWRTLGAGAVILALLGWNLSLQQQLRGATAEVVESRAGWNTTTALLNDPTVRAVALAGDGATGHVWATDGGDVGCVVIEGLPDLADGKVYQIWLRTNNQPVGVGTFETHGGSTWLLIWPKRPLRDFETLGVTIEPSGGSPAPTGQRVLFGSLDALGTAAPPAVVALR